MFSLRQITCAGFFGVYPGCLTLAHNLALLPYQRGALIGVAFGTLTQVIVTLLYFIIVATASATFDDPLLMHTSTRCAIAGAIAFLQLLSAVGCRIMGRYFLTPEHDVTTFDRSELQKRLEAIDRGKRSVVHDLTRIFASTPAAPPRPASWLHVIAATAASISATFWQICATNRAFARLWFDAAPMDFSWSLDLALDMAIATAALAIAGFLWLHLSTTRQLKQK